VRVDNVPALVRPFWLAASWIIAIAFWLMLRVLHATCRIRCIHRRGAESAEEPGESKPAIYCFWHENLPVWFVAFVKSSQGQAWLQHPAAYMKPTHIVLQLMGVRRLLGSRGEEGRRAAAQLAELLKQGYSTAINPDGPAGPPHNLRKGVLHISHDSGVPIIPVRLSAKPCLRLPTWDRKIVPLPFARIEIALQQPIRVENFEDAERMLVAALTAPGPASSG
jgi:lysophospholipid acyltransferase (LPLAT)-like uncharacterized protein